MKLIFSQNDLSFLKTIFLFSKRSFFSYEIDRLWEECNNSTIYIFDFQQLIFLSFCSILLLKLLSFQIDSLLIRIKRSIRPFVKSQTICKICLLAKQKHLPFQSHNNICDEPFDLIHIDILGPFSVETTEGFRYFWTIVDDHSRATWVYLLKSQREFLPEGGWKNIATRTT